MHRLLLIDGLNIVRRNYEAIPRDDSPDKAQSAITSSIGTLRRLISDVQPTHALIVFDAAGPNWRHSIFPEYKMGRTPMSDYLKDALPQLMNELNNGGIKTECVPGVEAEDVIATLGLKAISRGFEVVVSSNDKDLVALISSGIRIKDPFSDIWKDEDWVKAKYLISSALFPDLLALIGDEADGIPGIYGVGAKTAAKWLNTFGSLQALIDNAGTIKGTAGTTLFKNIEKLQVYRQLTQLKEDVSITITPRQLQINHHEVLPKKLVDQSASRMKTFA